MQFQQYNIMQPMNPSLYQSHSSEMPPHTSRMYDATPPLDHERHYSTQEYGVVGAVASSSDDLLLSNNPFRQQPYQSCSSESSQHLNQGYDVAPLSNDMLRYPSRGYGAGSTLNEMDHHGTQHYDTALPSNDLSIRSHNTGTPSNNLSSSENAFLQQATNWIPRTPKAPQKMLPVLQVGVSQ